MLKNKGDKLDAQYPKENGLFSLWVRQTLKYFFLFSDNKCKDEVHIFPEEESWSGDLPVQNIH